MNASTIYCHFVIVSHKGSFMFKVYDNTRFK